MQAVGADPSTGRFFDDEFLHPTVPSADQGGLHQLFGDAWEWTGSAYLPYPGIAASRDLWRIQRKIHG